jgi:amino acid adenylation domain-containing protein
VTVIQPLPEVDLKAADDIRLVVADLASRSEALAVSYGDHALTYAELDALARSLASRLQRLGVGAGDRVALCVPRSSALVVGAAGIIAAGASYVTLDPLHPAGRLRTLAKQAAVTAVVRCSTHPVDITDDAAVVELSPTGEVTGASPGSAPIRLDPVSSIPAADLTHPRPDDPAYVVFTSGSTGAPKGVVSGHRGLASLISWHRSAFDLTAHDRTTLLASPAFDASVWELWPTLAAGGSLHVPPDQLRTDPVGLRNWLLDTGITVSFVPTALAERLISLDWPAEAALRTVLTGGDALRSRPRQGLPFTLVNNYGVSEASVVSTSGPVCPDTGESIAAAPSIGRAIDGVVLDVVDEQLQPVPDGQSGELLVGGVSVALGYLDQPALTAAAFVTRYLPDGSASRWYRTGDLVRRSSDGSFTHLGRRDEQVQIRGARVELGEVAAVLGSHPRISACVATGLGAGDDVRLVAHVVLAGDGELDRQALLEFAADALPEVMLPTAIVVVPELPMTANGKVDRKALPPPTADDRVHRGSAGGGVDTDLLDDVAPADPELVAVVATVIAELLGLPEVSPLDNFFLLGGHSLLGAQLIARLATLFGVEVPLRLLFQNPTAAGVARSVEQALLAELDALANGAEVTGAAHADD